MAAIPAAAVRKVIVTARKATRSTNNSSFAVDRHLDSNNREIIITILLYLRKTGIKVSVRNPNYPRAADCFDPMSLHPVLEKDKNDTVVEVRTSP